MIPTTVGEFRNELVKRLNKNANRYTDEEKYPSVEFFEVDEIYEIIDRVSDGIPEDLGDMD